MRRQRVVESGRDRLEMAHEAGFPSVSLASVLAGVLVAYGAFAIVAAIAGGVFNTLGVDTTELSNNDWRELGIGSGIAVALSLFLSYFFGGYVAGRMARRAGVANGLVVFVFGILVAAGIGAAVSLQDGGDAIVSNLRSIGVPTSGEEWTAVGTLAGVGAVVAMLLGSLFGGMSGERWHGMLLARAMDPAVGAERTEVDLRRHEAPVVDTYAPAEGAHLQDPDHDDIVPGGGHGRRRDTTLDEDLARTRIAH